MNPEGNTTKYFKSTTNINHRRMKENLIKAPRLVEVQNEMFRYVGW